MNRILSECVKDIVIAGLMLSAIGCAQHSVFLQDVRVEAPYAQLPVFLSQENAEGSVRVATRVSVTNRQTLGGRIDGHSKVNDRGIYQLDRDSSGGTVRYFERAGVNKREFQGQNFFWQPTDVNASLDFEYAASKRIVLVGGIEYSSASSGSYLGTKLGLGFLFQSRITGGRFDVGVQFSSGKYRVEYVVSPSRDGLRDAEVQFLTTEGRGMHAGYYSSFTFNTMFDGSVQGFLQLAINRQYLFDFSSKNALVPDYTVAQSASFFSVTPGIAFALSSSIRLMTGVRLGDETALLEADRSVLLVPFVQFEFGW